MAAAKTELFVRKQPGGVFTIVNEVGVTTGDIFFVDSGATLAADSSGAGNNPDVPFATLDYAIDQCADDNGDKIIVMAGHAETLTSSVTLDKAGIKILCQGNGTARPTFTVAADIDGITVTSDNCEIDNLYMPTPTTLQTSGKAMLNIAAAHFKVTNCRFEQSTNALECITVTAAGLQARIIGNEFIVTGNGPDSAIEIESATTDDTQILGNLFITSDGTDPYDAEAINSGVANTNMVIRGNTFLGAGIAGNSVSAASSVDKSVLSNFYGSGAVNADQDQFTGQVSVTAHPAPLIVDDAVWYVDSADGSASFDGHTPLTALITLAAAETLAAAGDTIIMASGHSETVGTGITLNLAGLTVIGSGTGTRRPAFTGSIADDTISLDAANITLKNVRFNEATTVTGGAVNIAASGCAVVDCQFDLGANDAEAITVATAGDSLTVRGCAFKVTADGPSAAIELEGTSSDLVVEDCLFDGGSDANAWDAAAINGGGALTGVRIVDNEFRFCLTAQEFITLGALAEPPVIEGNTFKSGAALVSQLNGPTTFYVDSNKGADAVGMGTTTHTPTQSINYAIGLCSAAVGDRILVAQGHAETVTTAIALDIQGVSIIGLGAGTNRPFISCATTSIDVLDITAADCLVENIGFNEQTSTANDSTINVGAANATIRNCHFDLGQYDLEAITVETAGDNLTIEDCSFKVTADGPDAAIELEGTSSDLTVRRNLFDGGSDANAWDAAAINSTTAATGVRIEDNDFRFCLTAQEFITLTAITEPPVIKGNTFKSGAALVSQLNEPATFYVDSGKGTDVAGMGTTRHTPAATLDHAVGLCSASAGDKIIMVAGHGETITAAAPLDVDVAGVEIIAEGHGADRATLTVGTDVGATVTVSAASVTMRNVLISNTKDNCTSVMTITGNDFAFLDGETRDTGALEAALVWTVTGDRCTVTDYVHVGEGTGNQAVATFQVTGTDRFKLTNFSIDAAGSVALISSLSTANTNIEINECKLTQRETAVGVVISLLSGDTGFIGPNIHIRLIDDDTDPWEAIDSGSDVNFIGPITFANGDDEAVADIAPGLVIEADQTVVQTPWGAARVITKTITCATSVVPIFTPSVGRSLVVGMYGEVTTNLGAAHDLTVQYTTTSAGDTELTAVSEVDGALVDEIWGVVGGIDHALSPCTARCAAPFIVDGGATGASIGVEGTEANSNTGVIAWTLLYIPLERGSLITAV